MGEENVNESFVTAKRLLEEGCSAEMIEVAKLAALVAIAEELISLRRILHNVIVVDGCGECSIAIKSE